MSGFTSLIDLPWAQALASTLLHFLWQGAAIGLAAYALLRAGRFSSSWRYGIGVATLALMLAAPLATFALLASRDAGGAPGLAGQANVLSASSATAAAVNAAAPGAFAAPGLGIANVNPGATSSVFMGVVLVGWLAGVVVLSVRLTGGWLVARRLATRAVRPVTPEIHALARRVAGRIALDRFVRFFESSSVAVPVTVGWMKPVVLLPVAAMSGLSTTQIEALLAHELAHIRRHDYLVNLLQSALETMLFYHPAVWWASKIVRAEREHCCDDIAVGVCDRVVYVSALSDLASMNTPRLALAATDGSLVARVRRLLGRAENTDDAGSSWVPTLFVLIGVAAIVPAVLAQSAGAVTSPASPSSPASEAAVAQGVAMGVPGGVLAGVPGGVAVGVRGGVAHGVGQSTRRSEQEREARIREERARELERELAETMRVSETRLAMELQRGERELVRARALAERQMADLQAEVALNQEQVARAQRLVERGLMSPAEVERQRARVSELLARVQETQREREQAVTEMTRHLQELHADRLSESRRDELDAALADARSSLADLGDVRVRPLERDLPPPADANARIAERDVLVVKIAGETALPTNYRVDTAGNIRLPLLGDMQVRGLTAAEARTLISERLADRRLAEGATITVTLHRPRLIGGGR